MNEIMFGVLVFVVAVIDVAVWMMLSIWAVFMAAMLLVRYYPAKQR